MTRLEFEKLEPFNEEKYKKGAGVLVLYGNQPTEPEEQRYFEEHPEPVVLKMDGRYISFDPAYARTVIRMLPEPQFKASLDYATENKNDGLVWLVKNTDGEPIASFLDATDGSRELAEEYAQFLNDVDDAFNEIQEEANSFYSTYFVKDMSTVAIEREEEHSDFLRNATQKQYTVSCCDVY